MVEHRLPKPRVVGSNPISRSIFIFWNKKDNDDRAENAFQITEGDPFRRYLPRFICVLLPKLPKAAYIKVK